MEGTDEFVNEYNDNPDTDFHTMVAEMANIPRKQAKTINLGMMYGMGVNKLSEQLDISVEEAKDIIKQYHSRVPFVKGLMNGVTNKLNERTSSGSLRSLLGRKCRFDLWEPDSFADAQGVALQRSSRCPRTNDQIEKSVHLQGAQQINPSQCSRYDQESDG